jgi:hypothetical protein
MKAAIWRWCKAWRDGVLSGEIPLTVDILWLAEIDAPHLRDAARQNTPPTTAS